MHSTLVLTPEGNAFLATGCLIEQRNNSGRIGEDYSLLVILAAGDKYPIASTDNARIAGTILPQMSKPEMVTMRDQITQALADRKELVDFRTEVAEEETEDLGA